MTEMSYKDIKNLAKTKGKTSGKGSKPRPINKTKFDENWDCINWKKSVKWENFTDSITKK